MNNNLSKFRKIVYWSLIGVFTVLYLIVAYVSLLHAIEFFGLANNDFRAVLLATGFEVGQMAVLFSILMTNNKHRALAWSMMILLTTVQITANVFSSFKYMDIDGGQDWTYWQRSLLFWMEAGTPEIYKVTISWIIGGILPVIALGMTSLVADNIKLYAGGEELSDDDYGHEDDYYYEDEEDEEPDKEIPKEDTIEERSAEIDEEFEELILKDPKSEIFEQAKENSEKSEEMLPDPNQMTIDFSSPEPEKPDDSKKA